MPITKPAWRLAHCRPHLPCIWLQSFSPCFYGASERADMDLDEAFHDTNLIPAFVAVSAMTTRKQILSFPSIFFLLRFCS
jgi:hypothetical protein